MNRSERIRERRVRRLDTAAVVDIFTRRHNLDAYRVPVRHPDSLVSLSEQHGISVSMVSRIAAGLAYKTIGSKGCGAGGIE